MSLLIITKFFRQKLIGNWKQTEAPRSGIEAAKHKAG